MEKFGKFILVSIMGLIFALIDAALATWILDWMHVSFVHWYQIALVVATVIGSALALHDIRVRD